MKRSVIEKIGMIKKEMFIWGDEKEYMARAIHNGIGLYTVSAAIHYHPKEKGRKGNIIPFISKYQILVKPEKCHIIIIVMKDLYIIPIPRRKSI